MGDDRKTLTKVVSGILYMYLDEDRDSKIDKHPAQCNPDNGRPWRWGDSKGKRPYGAIIMKATRSRAYYDNIGIVSERTEIVLQWGNDTPSKDEKWEARLQSSRDEEQIKFYKGKEANAEEVTLAKLKDLKRNFPDLKNGKLSLWMEANDFPRKVIPYPQDWKIDDGLVLLTLYQKSKEAGKLAETKKKKNKKPDEAKGACPKKEKEEEKRYHLMQKTVVRIAPWIMASDLDKTEKIYLMDFSQQNQLKNGNHKVSNETLKNEFEGLTGGLPIHPVTLTSRLRYLRDVMRFGTQTAAGTDRECFRVVLRGNNSKTTYQIPNTGIQRDNDGIGYIECGQTKETDLETGGNMVVSPPVSRYPFGRIICGSIEKGGMTAWKNFFQAQQIQRPVEVDTSWLMVGHSDEIVAFVPVVVGSAAGGPSFRLLLASPQRAYEILRDADVVLTELAGQQMDQEQAESRAADDWRRLLAEEGAGDTHVDFQGFAERRGLARPIAEGNGRLAFHRFDNQGNCEQRWIHSFFLGDPLLNRLTQWPEGGRERLRVAGARYFSSLLISEVALRNKWISDRADIYEPYIVKAAENIQEPVAWLAAELGRLRNFLTRIIRKLERQEPLPSENLGKIHTIDVPGIQNLGKARVYFQRAGSDLFACFPSDDSYRTTCTELLNALRGVGATLPSPSSIRPGEPKIDSIGAALINHYREKNRDPNIQPADVDGLLHANLILQIKLDKIKAFICKELSIGPDVVISVPVLYHAAQGAQTLVADMINFVQLNKPGGDPAARSTGCTCIIPKPYGPVVGGRDLFQDELEEMLAGLGIDSQFIDDWYEYHLDGGEIHCGTNQLPAAVAKKWWEVPPPVLPHSEALPAHEEGPAEVDISRFDI